MSVVYLNSANAQDVEAENTQSEVLSDAALHRAREEAKTLGLAFAGSVSPENAWRLFTSGKAHIVDVRAIEERKFVGHVPNTLHVAWQTGPALIKNPRFLRELEQKLSKDVVVLFLCRSGKRSAAAAEAATKAGFNWAFNIAEGFEGDLDGNQQRGSNGWRTKNLPWVQD